MFWLVSRHWALLTWRRGGALLNTGRRAVPVVIIACLVGLTVLAAARAVPDQHRGMTSADRPAPVLKELLVGSRGCAAGIGDLRSGRNILRFRNNGGSPEEVAIMGRDHRYAYGELEMIAPGTTRDLVVVLPAGRFSVSCEADDGTVGYSDPITVTGGAVTGVHRWIPATQADLANVITRYRASVAAGLQRLAADTDKLQAAVGDHDRASLKARWLTAHLDYERLGAAYGTFGDYDAVINGLPDGLPRGVHDHHFTGFHRIEYLLWHNGSQDQLNRAVRQLDRHVHALVKAFPHQLTQPNDVPLRSHEILEATLQLTMTGHDDFGSHSTLATVAADIEGTRMTLRAVTPLLEQNDPALLSAADRSLGELDAVLVELRHRDGSRPALQSLTGDQRRRLDGTMAGTLETLAPIPTELEVLTTRDGS